MKTIVSAGAVLPATGELVPAVATHSAADEGNICDAEATGSRQFVIYSYNVLFLYLLFICRYICVNSKVSLV